MRIAVTSQNFKTITGHAGKARRFIVYESDGVATPLEVERLDLPKEMTLHEFHDEGHPLFALGLDALITQGAGQGFVQRVGRNGIAVHVTSATDPVLAVTQVASGQALPPGEPHDHDHDHDHGEGHGHGHGHHHGDGHADAATVSVPVLPRG